MVQPNRSSEDGKEGFEKDMSGRIDRIQKWGPRRRRFQREFQVWGLAPGGVIMPFMKIETMGRTDIP